MRKTHAHFWCASPFLVQTLNAKKKICGIQAVWSKIEEEIKIEITKNKKQIAIKLH